MRTGIQDVRAGSLSNRPKETRLKTVIGRSSSARPSPIPEASTRYMALWTSNAMYSCGVRLMEKSGRGQGTSKPATQTPGYEVVNDTLKNAARLDRHPGTLNTATKKAYGNAHTIMTAETQCSSFWLVGEYPLKCSS